MFVDGWFYRLIVRALTDTRLRLLLLGGCGLFALVTSAGLLTLKFEGSIESFIPKGTTTLIETHDARRTFAQGDPIAIAVVADQADALLSREALQSLVDITDRVDRIPGIDPSRTQSLATEPFIRKDADGLDSSPLVPRRTLTDEDAARIRAQIGDADLYKGRLFANDRSGFVVLGYMKDGYRGDEPYDVVQKALAGVKVPAGMQVHITGLAVVIGFMSSYIQHDVLWVNPLCGVMVSLVLIWMVRRALGVALAMTVMALTIGSTVGIMCWLGVPVYIMTNSLPAILVAVSVAESIHYLLAVYTRRRDQPKETDAEAIEAALHSMWTPLLMVSITTFSGFLSIALTTSIWPIVVFGMFAALGVVFAWIFTLILLPLGLVYLLPHTQPMARASQRSEIKLARVLLARPWIPVSVFVVGIVGLGFGIPRLTVNEMATNNFARDSPIVAAERAFNARFDGSFTYNLDISLPQGLHASDPQVVDTVREIQAQMKAVGIASSLSYVDLAEWIQKRSNADTALPRDAESIDQLLFLYTLSKGPSALAAFVTPDQSRLLIRGFYPTDDQRIVDPMVKDLMKRTQAFEARGYTIHHTDQVPLSISWIGPLLSSALNSTLLEFVVVIITLVICFRSPREVLLLLTPVIGGVIGVYGIMGLTGIWLDIGTSMFGSIATGIGVDFAIHVLHSLKENESKGLQGMTLAVVALGEVIRPLAINALSLIVGFSAVFFSVIPPLHKFAILINSGIALSFFVAIFLVPILYTGILWRRGPRPLARPAQAGVSA
jgi:predicted RND superfamily exporter protein